MVMTSTSASVEANLVKSKGCLPPGYDYRYIISRLTANELELVLAPQLISRMRLLYLDLLVTDWTVN